MTVKRANNSTAPKSPAANSSADVWIDTDGEAVILFDNTLPFSVLRLSSGEGGLQVEDISANCRSVWGIPRDAVGGAFDRLRERIHPQDLPRVDGILAWAIEKRCEWSATFRILHDNADEHWVVARGLTGLDRNAETWIVMVTDINAQISAFASLRESEMKLRALAESIPGAAFHSQTDTSGRETVNFLSAACQEIWEHSAEEIRRDPGLAWRQIHPQDVSGLKASLKQANESLEPWFHQWRILTPSGRAKWLEGRGRPERRPDGTTVWSGLVLDVSEQRRQERELRRLAEHDDLTGLANRMVLNRRLDDEIALHRDDGGQGALLVFDIDGFNEINDVLGHGAGDTYLRTFAERLLALATPEDLAARLGGDEFALLLSGMESEADLGAAMTRFSERLDQDIRVKGTTVTCSVSIGGVLFPRDGATAEEAMRHANIALSEARNSSPRARAVYAPDMTRFRDRRSTLAGSLRAELARDGLDIAFQPIVTTGNGSHSGFEALARWTLDGRPVSPAEFIPLADETGLAVPLGTLLLRKALKRAADLRAAGHPPGVISVNVSAAQIRDPDFFRIVEKLIAEFDHPPEALEIEVTETVILGRWAEQIAATLRRLRQRGVRVALDDFGTGYASLVHLKQIRVDRLKIDRSFISNVDADPGDAAIVKAILGLAEALGLEVVAEGVETSEQLAFLRDHGCVLAQGYLFGRPTPNERELLDYLRSPPQV
ncbi:bifunctional diguanylate cyclase/phosphodiesterase [Stappia sp.]|uniref:putative bifunctional diguanylate cyclase/phosphodiesterase n=1 Tax=Stappia sp. TaxID=1870903 RepID=UPI0025F49264|nr:GGDEF domain-containing phosphodiesterase [Stappia sp.]